MSIEHDRLNCTPDSLDGLRWCLTTQGTNSLLREIKFRQVLPVLQTVIAISFDGRGLWIRNSTLSRPFLGDSTGWDTTLRFHVWPWPLKFAAILNMPAFLAGGLLSLPLDYLRPGLPEWVSTLPLLLFVSLFWYWVGRRADKNLIIEKNPNNARRMWFLLLLFVLVCAAAASISGFVGGYTSWVVFGLGIWLIVGFGIKAVPVLTRHNSNRT